MEEKIRELEELQISSLEKVRRLKELAEIFRQQVSEVPQDQRGRVATLLARKQRGINLWDRQDPDLCYEARMATHMAMRALIR